MGIQDCASTDGRGSKLSEEGKVVLPAGGDEMGMDLFEEFEMRAGPEKDLVR